MEQLSDNEKLVLGWIFKKVQADLIMFQNEKDPELKKVRRKAILDTLENTNNDHEGLLEAIFIVNFQEDDYHWKDLVSPYFFETSINRYLEKLGLFLNPGEASE